MPFPYATPQDVEVRWRTLSASEAETATALIADAADMIRVRWSDIDSRVADGSLREETIVRIIAGMVRRAMMNRDVEGVVQFQETAGPMSGGATFANPTNSLYLTGEDVKDLDAAGRRNRSRMGWLA